MRFALFLMCLFVPQGVWAEECQHPKGYDGNICTVQFCTECGEIAADSPKVPSNQIWYTSSDGNAVGLCDQSDLNDYVVSNKYEGGLGKITFDHDLDLDCIEDDAFTDAQTLKTIILPSSVKTIASAAFLQCSDLESIYIPSSVTTINGAFVSCYMLKSRCYNYSNVTDVGIDWVDTEQADGLLIKGTELVSCRRWATSVTIPEGVTIVKKKAIWGCRKLADISIASTVTTIDSSAIWFCDSLKVLNIPEGVTTIGNGAIDYCPNLQSISIPSTATSIDKHFIGSNKGVSLSSITVAEGNPVYDSREGCNAIIETSTNTLFVGSNNTVIPDGIVSIGAYAFDQRDALTSITFPSSVASCGDIDEYGLFYFCLPSCLTNIVFNSVPKIPSVSLDSLKSVTLSLTDESYVASDVDMSFFYQNKKQVVKSSYTRTMASEWESLVVPFSFEASQQAGFEFYRARTIVDGNYMALDKLEGNIERGTPVLVHRTGENSNLTITGNDYDINTRVAKGLSDGICRNGVYAAKNLANTDANCYFIEDNALYCANQLAAGKTAAIKPFRAYFTTGSTFADVPWIADGAEKVLFDVAIAQDGAPVASKQSVSQITFNYNNGSPLVLMQSGTQTYGATAMVHEAWNDFSLTPVFSLNRGNTLSANSVVAHAKPRYAPAAGSLASATAPVLKIEGNGVSKTYQLSNTTPSVKLQLIDGKYYVDGTELCNASGVSISFYQPHDPGQFVCSCGAEPTSLATAALADKSVYARTTDLTVADFTYTRTFGSTAWASWYVPFAMPVAELGTGVEAYAIENVRSYDDDEDGEADRSVLEVIKVTGGSLTASTPYIILLLSGKTQ